MNGFLIFTEIFKMSFKKYIFLLCFLSVLFSKAQVTMHSMIYAGYEYQNQSFGEVGARFLFLKNDHTLYRISASGLIGEVNNKIAVIPKVQGDILLNFNEKTTLQHGNYFLLGAEVTNKYVAPKAGISLLGIVDFTGGYAFNFGNKFVNGKELKGVNFNVSINIPLIVFAKKTENK